MHQMRQRSSPVHRMIIRLPMTQWLASRQSRAHTPRYAWFASKSTVSGALIRILVPRRLAVGLKSRAVVCTNDPSIGIIPYDCLPSMRLCTTRRDAWALMGYLGERNLRILQGAITENVASNAKPTAKHGEDPVQERQDTQEADGQRALAGRSRRGTRRSAGLLRLTPPAQLSCHAGGSLLAPEPPHRTPYL